MCVEKKSNLENKKVNLNHSVGRPMLGDPRSMLLIEHFIRDQTYLLLHRFQSKIRVKYFK